MRAFVAIDIPDPVRDALEAVQEALPFGKLSDPEQFHVTLAFLGEQPDDLVEAAHFALEEVRFPAFSLQLQGLDIFRGQGVLWAGLRDSTQIAALQSKVLSALYGAGLALERRRFRPHVTLARLPRMTPEEEARLAGVMARWDSFPSPPIEVEDFALYSSRLTQTRAIHEELARYPLAGTAPA